MLENISLDQEGFEEIFRKARSQISEVYPEWNNYNYHDPGITILELMAFFKEAQHFQMNHTSDEVLLAYLKLWGISKKKARASTILGRISSDFRLKIGQEFVINNLHFQSEEPFFAVYQAISSVITHEGTQELEKPFYPFGIKPEKGRVCLLKLRKKLFAHHHYKLWFSMHRGETLRNPILSSEQFVPLSQVVFSYFNGESMVEIPVEDHTVGLLQDGHVSFHLEQHMEKSMEQGEEDYFLYLTLRENNYDVPPLIENMSFCQCALVQKQSFAYLTPGNKIKEVDTQGKVMDFYKWEEGAYWESNRDLATHIAIYHQDYYDKRVVACGNGFPNQSYELAQGILHCPSVAILVQSVMNHQKYHLLTQVDTFAGTTPHSMVYLLDEEKGMLCFGDGFHGFCPEGNIVVVGLALTQCKEGNVATGVELEAKNQHALYYTVQEVKEHGCPSETLQQVMIRGNQGKVTRMVTAEDYEIAIKETPGLKIETCRVLPYVSSGPTVWAVVKPGDGQRYLSGVYKENILRTVEEKRLLGTTLQLQSPTYTEIDLYLEVEIHPQYVTAKDTITQKVEEYFASIPEFGAVTEYSVLYGKIHALEAVADLKNLSIGARGDGISRNRNGDVITPPTSMTQLREMTLNIL